MTCTGVLLHQHYFYQLRPKVFKTRFRIKEEEMDQNRLVSYTLQNSTSTLDCNTVAE